MECKSELIEFRVPTKLFLLNSCQHMHIFWRSFFKTITETKAIANHSALIAE
jgi:hypothetical protein